MNIDVILKGWFILVASYLLALSALQIAIGVLSVGSLLARSRIRRAPNRGSGPDVAVVILAHNEELTLVGTLDSLLEQTIQPHSIIVIDDGSTDQTGSQARRRLADSGSVKSRVLTTRRQGKHMAQELGISQVECELTCIADADVEIDPNALGHLSQRLLDQQATAVSAWVWPATQKLRPGFVGSLLLLCQVIEYARAILWRPGWEALGGLAIVESQFGLFRTTALRSLHGAKVKQSAVDYNLTLELYRSAHCAGLPCRICVEPRAAVWTDVPLTMRDFFAQRMRHARGFLKAFVNNRDMIFRRSFGTLGMLELPVRIFTSVWSIVELSLWLSCVLLAVLRHPWARLGWSLLASYLAFVIFQLYLSLALGRLFTVYRWRGGFNLLLWSVVPLAAAIWEPIKGLTRLVGWSRLSLDRQPWEPRRSVPKTENAMRRSEL